MMCNTIYQLVMFQEDVIIWKCIPTYWPFVRGIHQWLVDSPHKGPVALSFVFSWCPTEQSSDQTIEMSVNWDGMGAHITSHSNEILTKQSRCQWIEIAWPYVTRRNVFKSMYFWRTKTVLVSLSHIYCSSNKFTQTRSRSPWCPHYETDHPHGYELQFHIPSWV